MDGDFDVIVIGGGIAGTAVAAHLASALKVLVLEMEGQPGYHSTGRSAALFTEVYGNDVIRALTRASRPLLFSPPTDFSEEPLVAPREVMIFGTEARREPFEAFVARELPSPGLRQADVAETLRLCPVLRQDGLLGSVVDARAADIEVHALHQGYLRQLKQAGGALVLDAKVEALDRVSETNGWKVRTRAAVYRAPIVVNAAGAWADEIAALAGLSRIGIEPRRRTAALIDCPVGVDASGWPMIMDADESFYMKPDAGLLLISPADETPSEPEDAQPDELDVAIAADRVETHTTIEVRRLKAKWAGLRSFVADRSPVVGFDGDGPGFFWLAALGGYGIQTAPALSELAAKLVRGASAEQDFAALGFGPDAMSPDRLRNIVSRDEEYVSADIDERQPKLGRA